MNIENSWQLSNSFDAYKNFNLDFNRFLDKNCVDATGNYALNVAVEELITNIIKFNPEDSVISIDVSLSISETTLELNISDNAGAFDIRLAPKTDISKNIRDIDIGGLGIDLVRKLFNVCEYRYVGKNNSVRLVYYLPTE